MHTYKKKTRINHQNSPVILNSIKLSYYKTAKYLIGSNSSYCNYYKTAMYLIGSNSSYCNYYKTAKYLIGSNSSYCNYYKTAKYLIGSNSSYCNYYKTSCCTPDILYTFTNKAETRKNTHLILIFNMKVLLVN
jgi:hypothetical protein